MAVQFIQIDNTIINVQQITHVEYTVENDTPETTVWFGEEFHVFRGENAQQFWTSLKYQTINITPHTAAPELPVLGAKQAMLSNLFNVCKKAENTQKLVRRSCKDCVYFNESDYLTCAVHPITAPDRTDIGAWRANDCKDWELRR